MRPGDIDPSAWLAVGFPQINTFLALVREGGVTRAARRLGIGHSTASAHIKLMTDCFGRGLLGRLQGGLMATEAGLDAYAELAPVMARARSCLDGLGSAGRTAVTRVVLPAGFPGSLLDRAVEQADARLRGDGSSPRLLACGVADDEPAVRVTQAAAEGSGRPDRWVLLWRAGALPGGALLDAAVLPLEDLAGLTVHLPRVDDSLVTRARSLTRRAEAMLTVTDAALPDLLARFGHAQSFCALIPASLLNPALVAPQFDCAPLAPGSDDPWLCLAGPTPLVAALGEDLSRLLADRSLLRGHAGDLGPSPEPDPISLKHCRSFLALYEEGNMRRAAQRLCIVQPALTVQLHRIEEQVGMSLFQRASNGLKPQPAAADLYGILRPLVSDLDMALHRLHASESARNGRVRIGLMPALDDESLTAEAFASALDQWRGAHPHCLPQVSEAYSDTLLRWLRAGKVDFILVDRPPLDPDVVVDHLAEDPMAVLVDRDSGRLPPGPVTLEAMARLPLVLPSYRHGLRSLLADKMAEQGLALTPAMEIDSMAATLALVKTGRYATVLPISAVRKSTIRRRLSVHEVRSPAIRRTICLVRSRLVAPHADTLDLLARLRVAFGAMADDELSECRFAGRLGSEAAPANAV